jgi:uncharacterized protein (DUF2126 family)
VKALDGPSGPAQDFTDLHAWAEAYLPGAGWIGLDPTSGLFAGEGHIPLACTAHPHSAAPIVGATDPCNVQFSVSMSVMRVRQDPRVTKPYSESEWDAICALGEYVDEALRRGDVHLTMGGEPTFVSVDDMESPQWNVAALGDDKRKLAGGLLKRLKLRFAPGGLLHFGQGKWYPGEALPRWAMGCYWRTDGEPVWRDETLIADDDAESGFTREHAERFILALAEELGLDPAFVIPAYEDALLHIKEERGLPVNIDPLMAGLSGSAERARLGALLERGFEKPAGYVLPLKPVAREGAAGETRWASSIWPLRRPHLFLLPGDSPIGFRLPLDSLPWVAPEDRERVFERDPFADYDDSLSDGWGAHPDAKAVTLEYPRQRMLQPGESAKEVIHTALCVEARDGCVHVFLPPLTDLRDYLRLVAAVERTAGLLQTPVRVEGYPPPNDLRLQRLSVTPDPGVIEVNMHPAGTWQELVDRTTALYEEARSTRLGTEKFMIDGRHTGTGGGNHMTLGGPTPAESPLLRRPDLLRSLITYWQNHPALSYLFSGQFVGPTSQSPRVDEARDDSLYELEIAFQQMDEKHPAGAESAAPWLIDRLLRNLLVDATGNTHRAEFCIDKLYAPDSASARQGIVELRAFEMPPHPRMSLVQMLLLRALVARFWGAPYRGKLVRWGTELHDRFMLPHFIAQDMQDVIGDLRSAGFEFRFDWFAPFVEFRFPRYGTVSYGGVTLELRQAIEPWHVLGEEISIQGTARYVDSSVERLQVKVLGMTDDRHRVACNGCALPLCPTGTRGEFVAGVRYKAWNPPSSLHPTIRSHGPLTFDLVDTWTGRAVGGCTYYVAHPGGRNYSTFPVNANEAEARRLARFWPYGHTPGPMAVAAPVRNAELPYTLDLRRKPDS